MTTLLGLLGFTAQVVDDTGVNLAPIIMAVVAALGGSGVTAWLTVRRTNKKLDAEVEKIHQEALSLADERGQKNVETMERITHTLEARLTATELALEAARAKLDAAEAKIAALRQEHSAAIAEREERLIAAQRERDDLKTRIAGLEERLADLMAALPGKRRSDPKPGPGSTEERKR